MVYSFIKPRNIVYTVLMQFRFFDPIFPEYVINQMSNSVSVPLMFVVVSSIAAILLGSVTGKCLRYTADMLMLFFKSTIDYKFST